MLTFRLHPIVDGRCGCGAPDCKRAGKHPAEAWSQIPLDRPELQASAACGVGIKTGACSGVFVVDLDVKNGINGLDELSKLGPVPETYTVATPSGGFHLYFKHPGFVVRNSGPKSNPIAEGVDVRGDGGYVVAPGSPHVNGGTYSVAVDAPIADAPAWLLVCPELKHEGGELAAPAADIEARVSGVPRDWRVSRAKAWLASQAPAVSGQGGDAHTWTLLTRAVHDNCLTDANMIGDAFVEWNARCEPPWTGKDWAHKVKSVLEHSTLKWSDTLAMEYRLEARTPGTALPASASLQTEKGLGFKYGAWNSEPPQIAFLVDGLLPRACVGMVFGRADALKTWLLFSLGLAVASGRPWLGHFNVKQAKVGLVDFETGAGNVDRRLYMLRAGENPNLGAKSFPALKPSEPRFWELLALEAFELVIVDSLRKANPGANENDSDEAIVPLALAAEFSEKTGCAVLFIHHAKKASSDGWPEFRGSGAIEDQVDCAFAVRKTDVTADRKTVEVRCEKPGDMRTPAAFVVEVTFDDAKRLASLQRVEPPADTTGAKGDDSSEALQAAIRLKLATGPIAGVKGIAKAVSKNEAKVRHAVGLMVESREIVKTERGFELDDEARRTARVLSFVREHVGEARINSVSRLADAAHVSTNDVKRLLLEHVIERAVGNDKGGFVLGRNGSAPDAPAAPP